MKEVYPMQFGEILIKRRKEIGMTQDDLAEKLGVSRQSVSKWENGECMPDSEKLIKLSDVLGISLDELTGRRERTAPETRCSEVQAPEIPERPKGKPARILLAAAAALVIAALCFFAGRYLFPRASEPSEITASGSEAPTAAPPPKPTETPGPTAIPTDTPEPPFRLDCHSKDRLNEHDYNAVLAWLEAEDHLGKKNGEKLNPDYDPDDPTTWYYDNAGEMCALAQWDDEGYLTSFTAFVENRNLYDNIDLSGCVRLDYVAISDYNLAFLDLTGCPLGTGLWLSETSLIGISPDPLVTNNLIIDGSQIEHIHWIRCGFELTLDAEGEGYVSVGILTLPEEDYTEIYIVAYTDPVIDDQTFVGWFDANGRLVSTDPRFELTSLGTNGILTGKYAFTARFK